MQTQVEKPPAMTTELPPAEIGLWRAFAVSMLLPVRGRAAWRTAEIAGLWTGAVMLPGLLTGIGFPGFVAAVLPIFFLGLLGLFRFCFALVQVFNSAARGSARVAALPSNGPKEQERRAGAVCLDAAWLMFILPLLGMAALYAFVSRHAAHVGRMPILGALRPGDEWLLAAGCAVWAVLVFLYWPMSFARAAYLGRVMSVYPGDVFRSMLRVPREYGLVCLFHALLVAAVLVNAAFVFSTRRGWPVEVVAIWGTGIGLMYTSLVLAARLGIMVHRNRERLGWD